MAQHGATHLRALYAVFVGPALRTQSQLSVRRAPQHLPPTHRPLSTTVPLAAIPRRKPGQGQAASRTTPTNTPLRDNDIPARRVQVVDDATNTLGQPQTKFSAMRGLDPATHRLVCVSKPPRYLTPSDPEYDELAANYDAVVAQWNRQQQRFQQGSAAEADAAGEGEELVVEGRVPAILVMPMRYIRMPSGEEWVPVCRIENKVEVAARARELAAQKKEQKKLAPDGVKIIELNWAIDANDLGHRLRKVEEFLQARRRVEIVVAPKRRGRKASPEECETLVKRIRDAVANVEGAKEVRPMNGKLGEVASLMLEGNRGK